MSTFHVDTCQQSGPAYNQEQAVKAFAPPPPHPQQSFTSLFACAKARRRESAAATFLASGDGKQTRAAPSAFRKESAQVLGDSSVFGCVFPILAFDRKMVTLALAATERGAPKITRASGRTDSAPSAFHAHPNWWQWRRALGGGCCVCVLPWRRPQKWRSDLILNFSLNKIIPKKKQPGFGDSSVAKLAAKQSKESAPFGPPKSFKLPARLEGGLTWPHLASRATTTTAPPLINARAAAGTSLA